MAELIYGLRKSDGKLVSIYDIPADFKGLKCDCICPHCNTDLIARKGNIREHHFAHHNEEHSVTKRNNKLCVTDVDYANQTALHLMAKEIIMSAKNIMLPAYEVDVKEVEFEDIPDYVLSKLENEKFIYRQINAMAILSAEKEKRIEDIISDISIHTPIGEIMIEIAVTHFIDKKKYNKIKEKSASVIEIDLSEYREEGISRKDLEKVLLREISHKKWIYRKDRNIAIKKAKEYFESTEAIGKYRWTEHQRKSATVTINNILKSDNYKKVISALRNEQSFIDFASKNLWFFKTEKMIPYHIDIPITGEFIFKCDRRIWQGIIFDRYVYNYKRPGGKIPAADILFDKLVKEYNIPFEKRLLYQVETDLGKVFFRKDVLEQYLTYLDFLGFIKYNKYKNEWGEVVQNGKIRPSDTSNYEYFLQVLNNVDKMAPNIDDLLNTEIRKRIIAINEKKKKKEQERLIAKENKIMELLQLKEALEKVERESEEKSKGTSKQELAILEKERVDKNRKLFENVDFYNNDAIIRDESGNRWVLCEKCKQKYPSEQMAIYGGNYKNVGLCRQCERKERK